MKLHVLMRNERCTIYPSSIKGIQILYIKVVVAPGDPRMAPRHRLRGVQRQQIYVGPESALRVAASYDDVGCAQHKADSRRRRKHAYLLIGPRGPILALRSW